MNKNRRLPNGNTTGSVDYYLRSWKKEARPLVKQTGWKLTAFDPDFQFVKDNNQTITLPLWAVRDLVKK